MTDEDILQRPQPGSASQWTSAQENLLAGWAERAAGYRWLHDRASKYYDLRARALSVPSSVLAYLSGGAILSTDVSASSLKYFIGFLSILGGILSNLQGSLRWKELTEKHSLVSKLFSAYHRNVSAELALAPKDRVNPIEFLRLKRAEFDRIIEQCPSVPDSIITDFNTKYKGNTRPDIVNEVHPVRVYRDRIIRKRVAPSPITPNRPAVLSINIPPQHNEEHSDIASSEVASSSSSEQHQYNKKAAPKELPPLSPTPENAAQTRRGSIS
jgi:hypothetical protein